MSITAETLAARSKQQQAMTQLIGKLKAATQRVDNIVTLGCKTEKEALEQAAKHLSKATDNEIIDAMKRLEQCKLKTYDSIKVPGIIPTPFAGIPDTLKGISKADLATWLDRCKKTTFGSGNKYQPLPTHDEAWQIYVGIFQDSHVLKQHANNLRTHAAPRFSDKEVTNAAIWGFWHSMTIQLRRKAYELLPKEVKESIKKDHKGNPEGAMDAVREYYDELCNGVKL